MFQTLFRSVALVQMGWFKRLKDVIPKVNSDSYTNNWYGFVQSLSVDTYFVVVSGLPILHWMSLRIVVMTAVLKFADIVQGSWSNYCIRVVHFRIKFRSWFACKAHLCTLYSQQSQHWMSTWNLWADVRMKLPKLN